MSQAVLEEMPNWLRIDGSGLRVGQRKEVSKKEALDLNLKEGTQVTANS